MKYCYLNLDKAKQGVCLVHAVMDEKIDDYKKVFKDEYGLEVIEFEGVDIPHWITYDEETNTVREATKKERFARGEYQLEDMEYADAKGIILDKPPIPEGFLIPYWCPINMEWKDIATKQEREAHELNKAQEFYRRELNIVSFFMTEYQLGLQSEKNLEEVRRYIKSIEPIPSLEKPTIVEKVERPSCLSKFK